MRNVLTRAAAAISMLIAVVVSVSCLTIQPAAAGHCTLSLCGELYHYNGAWDKPIPVRCDYGVPSSKHYVHVGHHDPCKDTDQVYVYHGAELWCRHLNALGGFYYYNKEFDATGWHKINDLWHKSCNFRHD